MAVAFDSYVSDWSGAGGDLVLGVPANTDEDDLLFVFLGQNDNDSEGAPTSPETFDDQATEAGGGNAAASHAATRVAGSSEPESYTFTIGEKGVGALCLITGADTTNPVNIDSAYATADSTSISSPAVITTVDNCLVLYCVAMRQGQDVSANPGDTLELEEHTSAGTRAGIAIASKIQATAGDTGAGAWTLDSGEECCAYTIAFAPAGGAPPAVAVGSALVSGRMRSRIKLVN